MQTLIAVCGPSKAEPELLELAESVGREIARAGFGLVCGGLAGVMLAACRGARAEGGLTVGILPGYNHRDANPYVDTVICTGLGHARNMLVVATGVAVIAVGGEWGTLSEIALAVKLGRPVIAFEGYGWNLGRASNDAHFEIPIRVARTPSEAIFMVREAINK